jgi:ribonuclease Z
MSYTTAGGLRIKNAKVVGGMHSIIHVATSSSTKSSMLFDCGLFVQETIGANWVFISHGHNDHIGACVSHARARSLSKGPAIYYVPECVAGPLKQVLDAFCLMDGHEIPMDIRVISPGESVIIGNKNEFRVMAFQTKHRVDSQGYAVFSTITTKAPKLFDQYIGLTGRELGQLKSKGIKIESDAIKKENLDLVYTGDTTFDALILPENLFIFAADIIILECTYLDGPQAKALQYQHIHLLDIVDNAQVFGNKQIVLTHLSSRYSWNTALLHIQNSALPDDFKERTVVTLESLGCKDNLTPIISFCRPCDDNAVTSANASTGAGGGGERNREGFEKKRFRGGKVCTFFDSPRGCYKGAACPFDHI